MDRSLLEGKNLKTYFFTRREVVKAVHDTVKKIVKRVLEGTVTLPGKYSKLIEEAMLGYKEEQLTLVGAEMYN